MTNPARQLHRVNENLFIDLCALNAVRFESNNGHETAHLTFKEGGSEIVDGDAARSFHEYLKGGRMQEVELPPSLLEEGRVNDASPADPSSRFDYNFTAPSSGRNKAWFYGKDETGRRLIFALVNAKGSCSVRPFDAEKNIALGKRYGSGPYQEYFSKLLMGAIEIFVDSQPNLERDCKQRLPDRVFSYLRKQIEGTP